MSKIAISAKRSLCVRYLPHPDGGKPKRHSGFFIKRRL
jgi:hypothetical protein